MTHVGTVIEGKYEILKEIGRGGMSVVYLANDTHLNRNWAVKEVRKKGNGKNDEIVVNSLLAEANMVKRLDHPALPRIVDIIDNGSTIYIVMDFIEGESLDKILNEYGAQPEDKVIEWAMQICDVLSYLHSQKPPIIYRDMKPANLMLKPNGNISIIDFGIAREYKEQNLADTTVLGTKGYAPPEQYSGQTDPRSDIFALGMTMHHLLTGIDPRNGEPYAPVRQWNPELSEGIEAIINKCVEPAAENRYQSCAELLVDLQDPSKVTKGWRKKLKRRLFSFVGAAALAVVAGIAGLALNLAATQVNSPNCGKGFLAEGLCSMNSLTTNGKLTEMECGANFAVILKDNAFFLPTEYKVLQSQKDGCFVKCMRMLYNGKTELYYFAGELKSLSSLLSTIDAERFLTVLCNLLGAIINVQSNGFLTCRNIDASFERIYIDPNTYKVNLVYLPLKENLFDDDTAFENEIRTSLVKLIAGLAALSTPKMMQVSADLQNGSLNMENLYAKLSGKVAPVQNGSGTQQGNSAASGCRLKFVAMNIKNCHSETKRMPSRI